MNTPNTPANALAQRAMLVALNLSWWRPGKIDANVSEEVAAKYGMTANKAGKYEKYVIPPSTPSYRAVKRAFGDIRTRYYWHTLPWAHNGVRILPAVLFAKYSEDMRGLTLACEDAAAVFCGEFPRLAELSIAESKGLITADDIPTDIRSRFAVDSRVMPIPTAVDFRVQMADEDAARVRAQMEAGVDAQVRDALVNAARAPYVRMYEHVKRMVERLSEKEPSFHDTLITGLHDICAMMPAWNITDDPQLQALQEAAEKLIANVDPEHLKTVPSIRAKVCREAAALKELLAPHVANNTLTEHAADNVTREAAGIEVAMGNMFGFAKE